jgi:ketosteroid isomerase-like protein
MSQGNVELVRRVYQLWATRGWSRIPEFFHPDVEIDLSRNIFNAGVYRGYDGVERMLAGIEEMWDNFRIDPTDVIGSGQKVLATVSISGTGKGSGVDTAMQVMNVWTVRDSKIARVVGGFRDRAEALREAGLPPE